MSEVKWIKLSVNMFNDEAIKIIEDMPEGDAIINIWLKLLLNAGKINDSGAVYLKENIPYTEEMLSIVFNKKIFTIRLAIETLQKLGLIEIDETNAILIKNWEKHQSIEKLDKFREQNRKRVAKHRENKKLEECNVTVMLRNSSDKNKKENKIKNKNKEQEFFSHEVEKLLIEENIKKIFNYLDTTPPYMNCKIKYQDVKEKIELYVKEILACNDIQKTYGEYSTHIMNKLKKEYREAKPGCGQLSTKDFKEIFNK